MVRKANWGSGIFAHEGFIIEPDKEEQNILESLMETKNDNVNDSINKTEMVNLNPALCLGFENNEILNNEIQSKLKEVLGSDRYMHPLEALFNLSVDYEDNGQNNELER